MENNNETVVVPPTNQAVTNQEVANQQEKSPIQEAKETLKALQEENSKYQQNIQRMQELQAQALISGSANAGQEIKKETAEEKKRNNAREFLKGSGIEDDIFPLQ